MTNKQKRRKARDPMTVAEKMDPGPERDAKIEEADALEGRGSLTKNPPRR